LGVDANALLIFTSHRLEDRLSVPDRHKNSEAPTRRLAAHAFRQPYCRSSYSPLTSIFLYAA
jgi:hypothetical protein